MSYCDPKKLEAYWFNWLISNATPRKADIANFLSINLKSVNERMREIRMHWIRLVPFSEMS